MPVESPRIRELRIEDLRFRHGNIRGKLVSDDGQPIPRAVSLVLDGDEVGRANVRGRDHHEGPFTWFVPARFYDGSSHTFEVWTAGEGEAAIPVGSLDRHLGVEAAPHLVAGAYVSERGRIEGYAWNSGQPTESLTVEVWEGGALVQTLRTDQPTPASAPEGAPPVCGFAFSPSDLVSWTSGAGRIIVPKLGGIIDLDMAAVLAAVAVDRVFIEDELVVTVNRSMLLTDTQLHVAIDGFSRQFRRRDLADAVQLFIERPLAADQDEHQLDVTFQIDGETVAAAAQAFRWNPPGGLLTNPDLRDWAGVELQTWRVEQGYDAQPAPAGDGVSAPPSAIIIAPRARDEEADTAAPVELEPLRLSQVIDLAGTTAVDCEMIARLTDPIEIQLVDGEGVLASFLLDGVGDWARYRRGLMLDRPLAANGRIELVAPAGASVELAYLDIGPQGFQRSALRAADTGPIQGVANGDFQDWAQGLTFQSTAASVETADAWQLSAPKGLSGVRAGLAQVAGLDGDVVYGFGVRGTAPVAPVRLSTRVNPRAVAQSGAWILSLVVQRHAGRSGSVSRIGRVLLTTKPDGAGPTVVLGRNILVGAIARPVVLTIDGTAWINAGVDPNLSVGEQPPVYLVIEYSDHELDVVISAVSLTASDEVAAEPERHAYVGFEDFNLMSQLDRLEGLDDWKLDTVSTDKPASDQVDIESATRSLPWTNWSYPRIDIVVPVYNAEKHTLGCLKSIVETTDIPYRLIVVNDGSAPTTKRALEAFAVGRPWVEVITNPENVGYTRASNIGLKAGRAPWVVLLNSDTVVTSGWLEGLLDVALPDDQIAMVGPLSNAATWQSVPAVRDRHGQWAVNSIPKGMDLEAWAATIKRTSQRAHPEAPLLNGFCTLIRRTALEQVGYLDEEIFPIGYGEEVDLCIRINKAGYRMHVADDVFVFHHKSSSFGKERRAVLAKQGGQAVRKKHRDVNLNALEQELAGLVPVLQLRDSLKSLEKEPAQ